MSQLVLVANAQEGSISTLRLHRDGATGLEPLATTGGLAGCGTFAVDPARDLVHAAYKGDPPGVATLRLDRRTGRLEELARHDVEDSQTYLSLAHGGTVLLGASYGGGAGRTWAVEHDRGGPRLSGPVSQIGFANLHCVVPAAVDGGTVAYFVSLGEDLLAQYRLGDDGHLLPLDPPTAPAPQGSGPRHLVVGGDRAYVMTEFSGEVLCFDRAVDGRLTAAGGVDVVDPRHGLRRSRLGADPVEEHLVWGADLHLAGSWLLTSERSSSELASVPLDGSGRPGAPVRFTPTQPQPRGFAVSPDGALVVAVGERSTLAELLRVEEDGSLTSLGTAQVGRGPNWVRILEGADAPT